MEHMDMIDKLKEKAGISREEAADALTRADWDMLEALVILEREGRIAPLTSSVVTADAAQNGYGFRTAAEALDFAHANRVAIAFLDIELPGESGVELAERLSMIEAHTNIIFLTCHTEYMRDALNSHCSGYILKPLTRESLWHELAHLRFPVRGIGR